MPRAEHTSSHTHPDGSVILRPCCTTGSTFCSVHKSWDAYFRAVDGGKSPEAAFAVPPAPGSAAAAAPLFAGAPSRESGLDRLALSHLIRAYQMRGHEVARLDPLGLANRPLADVEELSAGRYGFSPADMSRTFDPRGVEGLKGFLGPDVLAGGGGVTLSALLAKLSDTYCGSVGWEYAHIRDSVKTNWIRERVETATPPVFSKPEKLQIFDRLAYADHFERFLANKFNTAKRFGLEGAEALVPGLKTLIDTSTSLDVNSIVFGMPHRGRLSVLVNVIRKPMETLLKEFAGTHEDLKAYLDKLASGDWSSSGDVKYHLGTSFDRVYPNGRKVHLSLVANPSHLEAVNTVVNGKVRAQQDRTGDTARRGSMCVLMHGDASFAGQGVVYETMQLSQLTNYRTGGTVHIVVNNQVGFTTDPHSARSTLHCTDLGKAFDVPIFHVNADEPEAVTRVFQMAAQYRAAFGSDVIVDLVGYRRYGHNELDQPFFTQPAMYAAIATHPTALEQYAARLAGEGVATADELGAMRGRVDAVFAAAFERAKTIPPAQDKEWLDSKWKGFHSPAQYSKIKLTGVPRAQLDAIAKVLTAVPSGFTLHPSLARIMKAKEEALAAGAGLDWGTAEALAFGSLLLEGNSVRLSGQDVERGTFSHRHAVLHDQNSPAVHIPLSNLGGVAAAAGGRNGAPTLPAPFLASNSNLSEFGVMGFELGYSMEDPNQLVLWEAQFGDFVNGAQIIIDQFLVAGETKWNRQCGLVLLLPHGFEGQGPEHSSARMERFLQVCPRARVPVGGWSCLLCVVVQAVNTTVRARVRSHHHFCLLPSAPPHTSTTTLATTTH